MPALRGPRSPPSRPLPPFRSLAVLATVAALAAPFAMADHWQQPPGDTDPAHAVTFDHVKGNEWWVEVKVTAADGVVTGVDARAESGSYQPLTFRSWGAWAGSFHIPPGERVQFFAYHQHPSGKFDEWALNSCYFTHPAGVEQCDPGSTDDTTFAFRSPGGNAGWAQVYVDASRPVKQAWVFVDDVWGGTSVPMKHESWGAWTSPVRAPQGTTVRFYANDGASGAASDCLRWTTATTTGCPPRYGPTPVAPFMTRFDHWKGNEWWVEAKVGPVQPASVAAQDDGGPWVPLTWHSDWGTWAGSFHVEPGHHVRFQATFPDDYQGTYTSCWFTHPDGIAPDGSQICRNVEYGG